MQYWSSYIFQYIYINHKYMEIYFWFGKGRSMSTSGKSGDHMYSNLTLPCREKQRQTPPSGQTRTNHIKYLD